MADLAVVWWGPQAQATVTTRCMFNLERLYPRVTIIPNSTDRVREHDGVPKLPQGFFLPQLQ